MNTPKPKTNVEKALIEIKAILTKYDVALDVKMQPKINIVDIPKETEVETTKSDKTKK